MLSCDVRAKTLAAANNSAALLRPAWLSRRANAGSDTQTEIRYDSTPPKLPSAMKAPLHHALDKSHRAGASGARVASRMSPLVVPGSLKTVARCCRQVAPDLKYAGVRRPLATQEGEDCANSASARRGGSVRAMPSRSRCPRSIGTLRHSLPRYTR